MVDICPVCFKSDTNPGPKHDPDCPSWTKHAKNYGPRTFDVAQPQVKIPPGSGRKFSDTFLFMLIKQLLLLAGLVTGPYLWWNSSFTTFTDFLAATGAMLLFSSICYVSLPINLIPNWIPIIGTMDDTVAASIGVIGVLALVLSYALS